MTSRLPYGLDRVIVPSLLLDNKEFILHLATHLVTTKFFIAKAIDEEQIKGIKLTICSAVD